jgi:hypothetical protein
VTQINSFPLNKKRAEYQTKMQVSTHKSNDQVT